MKAPQFCPCIYHDTKTLYLEFDAMVLAFPYTEGGLSKALAHIPNVQSQPGYFTGGLTVAKKALKGRKVAKVRLTRGVAVSDAAADAMTTLLADLKEDKRR